ncbi:hypothetical protein J1N35_034507 [Gossypium stocksii]|uniref:Uncharacterized protein n=1 Tax=Gossypium stocksii TaxID=47602 RepID=A0A9D3US62_9ROSI|nr:hypothetical protein J1N35_034507 [Gossypium stocksii]
MDVSIATEAQIDQLRGNTFYRQSLKPTVISIVEEFYPNFLEVQDNYVFKRGIYVDVSPIAVEAIHRTPHYAPGFYENLYEDGVDYDEIINFLTKGRGNWV